MAGRTEKGLETEIETDTERETDAESLGHFAGPTCFI